MLEEVQEKKRPIPSTFQKQSSAKEPSLEPKHRDFLRRKQPTKNMSNSSLIRHQHQSQKIDLKERSKFKHGGSSETLKTEHHESDKPRKEESEGKESYINRCPLGKQKDKMEEN